MAIDTPGYLFASHVTPVNVRDLAQVQQLNKPVRGTGEDIMKSTCGDLDG